MVTQILPWFAPGPRPRSRYIQIRTIGLWGEWTGVTGMRVGLAGTREASSQLLGAHCWARPGARATPRRRRRELNRRRYVGHGSDGVLGEPSVRDGRPSSAPTGTSSGSGWRTTAPSTIIGSSQAPYLNTAVRVSAGWPPTTTTSRIPACRTTSPPPPGSVWPLHGFLPDCNPRRRCDTSAPSIFGQGETWKSYEESMPSTATLELRQLRRAAQPAVYYTTLPGCAGDDVSYPIWPPIWRTTRCPRSLHHANLIDDCTTGRSRMATRGCRATCRRSCPAPSTGAAVPAVFITWDEG